MGVTSPRLPLFHGLGFFFVRHTHYFASSGPFVYDSRPPEHASTQNVPTETGVSTKPIAKRLKLPSSGRSNSPADPYSTYRARGGMLANVPIIPNNPPISAQTPDSA
jgi:hypothetical protein